MEVKTRKKGRSEISVQTKEHSFGGHVIYNPKETTNNMKLFSPKL